MPGIPISGFILYFFIQLPTFDILSKFSTTGFKTSPTVLIAPPISTTASFTSTKLSFVFLSHNCTVPSSPHFLTVCKELVITPSNLGAISSS